MIVRLEKPSDLEAIRNVHIQAFANHPISRQTEHLIVDALREGNALSISLVAEDEDRIVGHVAFSPVPVDGRDVGWFTLGPVGVLPERQRQGIGSALIGDGLERLARIGARGCCLVGDPVYYRRFGFRNAPSLGIAGVPAAYFMCLAFSGAIPAGRVELHPAFHVTRDHNADATG